MIIMHNYSPAFQLQAIDTHIYYVKIERSVLNYGYGDRDGNRRNNTRKGDKLVVGRSEAS